MAKRFTDTNKWIDPWFTELKAEIQLLYLYALDNSDCAGIWKVNLKHFSYCTGLKITIEEAKKHLCEKVHFVKDDLAIIKNFIRFQYGKDGLKGNVLKGVMKSIKYNGLETSPYLTLSLPFPDTQATLQDKDKDKDKDIVLVNTNKTKLTPDEIVNLWNAEFAATGQTCPSLGSGEHLQNCLEAIKFLPNLDDWRNLFRKALASDFLTKGNDNWRVNLIWLVDYDNALKVLSGNFDQENSSDAIIKDFLNKVQK